MPLPGLPASLRRRTENRGIMLLNKLEDQLLRFGINAYLCPSKNGPVAEWLGSALQKLLQRFESARDLEKIRFPSRNSEAGIFV